jgi:hypothetical protein|eukprot:SAG31_NODE_21171_length_556_cov_0.897155_2_plen_54_part_00
MLDFVAVAPCFQLKIAEDEEMAEMDRLKQLEAEAIHEAADAAEAERLAGKRLV